jgi:hypothetical protein
MKKMLNCGGECLTEPCESCPFGTPRPSTAPHAERITRLEADLAVAAGIQAGLEARVARLEAKGETQDKLNRQVLGMFRFLNTNVKWRR